MLRKLIFTFLVFASFSTLALSNDDSTPNALVERGATEYVANGPDAAVKSWISGSGLEGNKQALTQANVIRQVEDYYGKPKSFDVGKNFSISPHSSIVLLAINYEKGILFGQFQVYKTKSGAWILTAFKFNTDVDQVWPADAIYGN